MAPSLIARGQAINTQCIYWGHNRVGGDTGEHSQNTKCGHRLILQKYLSVDSAKLASSLGPPVSVGVVPSPLYRKRPASPVQVVAAHLAVATGSLRMSLILSRTQTLDRFPTIEPECWLDKIVQQPGQHLRSSSLPL